MEVAWVSRDGIERRGLDELRDLLGRPDGFVWLDVPACDEVSDRTLVESFGFHSMAVKACNERSHLPRVHTYPDHVFVIMHSPEPGERGHIHLLELDQFIGLNYLVTVHGPFGEGVDPTLGQREIEFVRKRIAEGRFHPKSPAEIAYGLVSAIALKQESLVSTLASNIAELERRVMAGDPQDPEEALEQMFKVRHELLTIRTMAAQSREVCARIAGMSQFLPDEGRPFIQDLLDQFDRLASLCDGEKEFLEGVVDYYQSRTATKINIAMERLALIAAVVLPVSAVAAIYGMNIIVPERTSPAHIIGVLAAMVTMMALMLRWARRHGWW